MKFGLSSFSSFLLDYGLFVIFTLIFSGLSFGILLANVLARLISGYYNYHMNSKHVFHSQKNIKTAGQYMMLAAFILLFNNIILGFYQSVIMIPVYPTKILAELTLFVLSFLVQKKIIYKVKQEENSVNTSVSTWGNHRYAAGKEVERG